MRLTLEIVIDFNLNGVSQKELVENLDYIATHAAENGLFTQSSPATVETFEYWIKDENGKRI